MTANTLQPAVDCLAPYPPTAPQRVKLPAGAWCTHAHIIDGTAQYPFVANRSYTPPPATLEEYIEMLDAVGLTYGVLVPISVHGTDNRLLLDALRRYPDRLRGVASISGLESEEDLVELHDAGVRGIRINELFSGSPGADHLQRLASRCATLGWHMDLGLHGTRLHELAPVLKTLEIPLVIDHMGFCAAVDGTSNPAFRAVLDLLQAPNVWIKISGAYRLSATAAAPYQDIGPFVKDIISVAPKRSIWASDWPHVAIAPGQHMPQVGQLLDAFAGHVDDDKIRHRILVENPSDLYGCPAMSAGTVA